MKPNVGPRGGCTLPLFLLIGLLFVGCASLQQKIDVATGVYKTATETTVPASAVVPVANTFDILKAAAANYGQYCIDKQMAPTICSATGRRVVIKAVRTGTGARNQLEDSVTNGTPAAASIYNVLVAAVTKLQGTSAASSQFIGSAK